MFRDTGNNTVDKKTVYEEDQTNYVIKYIKCHNETHHFVQLKDITKNGNRK